MDTYQWFVTILDALLSIFIALSVTVAIDRALFSDRYAYMNVRNLQWLYLQLLCSCTEPSSDLYTGPQTRTNLLHALPSISAWAWRCTVDLLFVVSIVPSLPDRLRRCGCGGRARSLRSTFRLPRCPTPKSAPCCTQCAVLLFNAASKRFSQHTAKCPHICSCHASPELHVADLQGGCPSPLLQRARGVPGALPIAHRRCHCSSQHRMPC